MALRAGGSAPNITAFHFRESVALVSGQCGVPQWPGTTKLSRGVGQQRGHVPPPVAALGGNGTSPLFVVRCSVGSVSGHGGVPPCPGSTRLSRGVRGSCGTRPLRPPASLLHNAALPLSSPPVAALKLRLVPVTASRPSGEGNRRYAKWPTLRSVCVRRLGYLARRFAHHTVQWPAAKHCVVSPRPPRRLAALARAVCPSAPQGGSLSPRNRCPAGFARRSPRRTRALGKKKPSNKAELSQIAQIFEICQVGKNVGKKEKSLETRMNTSYLAERASL